MNAMMTDDPEQPEWFNKLMRSQQSEPSAPGLSYSQFCQEISRERVRHDRKRAKLEARLRAFQATCKHKNTRFQEDPAGGSDSCHICTLCDKVVS